MTAPSSHIVNLIKGMDKPADRNGRVSGQAGLVAAVQRANPTQAQRQFVAELQALSAAIEPPPFRHPADSAPAAARAYGSGQIGDHKSAVPALSVDHFQFLHSLPSDPRSMKFADAAKVLGMRKAFHRLGVDPADRDTVDQYAQPIQDAWDETQALDEVHRAELHPFSPIPAAAISALADAIAHEVPSLEPGEAVGVAGDRVMELGRKRLQAHQDRIANAHAALDAVRARISNHNNAIQD